MIKELLEDIAKSFSKLDEKNKEFMSGVIVGINLSRESNVKKEIVIETNESSISLGG